MIAICIQWYVRYIYAFSIQIENLMQNKTAVSIHTRWVIKEHVFLKRLRVSPENPFD